MNLSSFLLIILVAQSLSPKSLGFLFGGLAVGRRRRMTTTQALPQLQAPLSSKSCFIRLRATGSNGFGFGGAPPPERQKKKKDKKIKSKSTPPASVSSRSTSGANGTNKPYVKSQTDDLIAQLQAKSAKSCLGLAVASAASASSSNGKLNVDPFWELIPSLIASKFPDVQDSELQRVAGFVRHAVAKANDEYVRLEDFVPSDEEIFGNPHRPPDEIHAYMPGLGPTRPFHDTDELQLCRLLSDNYETIRSEYHALLKDNQQNEKDRFQSVTSMNYKSGWKTMVLFYNGHRIPGFPYHLCPTTTRILESVPLAGRIAGFNRQKPGTGIPEHTDGNNMWLTCQMGIEIPTTENPNDSAYITVGDETRHWQPGQCLLYDTTYRHATRNAHATQERVVLHVDFFNTLAMTPVEIRILQYIYAMREEFMKAEGVVAKVGAQIL
jgi:aspartyl/asparaginyl beta-hydroxylase (cupin superfamily)